MRTLHNTYRLPTPDRSYRWKSRLEGTQTVISLQARSPEGAACGLYGLLQGKMGFCFHHPRESVIPKYRRWPLPEHFTFSGRPHFDKSGFHLHTMHPIELAEQILNPDYPNAFEDVTRYIDWLARNGQNTMQFVLLRGIDRGRWPRHAARIAEYAHRRGVMCGVQISMSMLQQQAFQSITLLRPYPGYRQQVDDTLARLFQSPCDFVSLEPTMGEHLPFLNRLIPDVQSHLEQQVAERYHALLLFGTHVIVDALLLAAQNGKQVAVVVELKARFDEATNIRLAEQMERAGIHVTYCVIGLKTHCKVIMIVRRDYNALRRYVHIGTGNYNADTTRIYSDMGLLSCSEALGNDVTELFNYLTTGFKPRRRYGHLLTAPRFLKQALLAKIESETVLHRERGDGLIQFKMNALEDGDIVKALYQAAQAGVQIDLIVRDTCRLRPGIKGLSENIRVVSIIGRFLEHSRIYYFRNGGAEEYFISSADAMKRNLEARSEYLCTVETPALAREIRSILDVYLQDTRSAWDMQLDGGYIQRMPADRDAAGGSHCQLMEQAEKRVELYRKRMKKKID